MPFSIVRSDTSKVPRPENVALADDLLVETVSGSGEGGLIDDARNVKTRKRAGVLGSLTLRVVEVGGNGDNGRRDGGAELRDLLHNHRRDCLGRL